MTGRIQFLVTRVSAAVLLAVGTAAAAAFGPEFVKSVIPAAGQQWWFLALFVMSVAVILGSIWLRKKARDLDSVGIVVSAVDPAGRERGRAIYESARRYAQQTFSTSVAPFVADLPADRAEAAERVDGLGDRVNELIGFTEQLAPSATRINLVLAMRNAAAFRFGMRLGRTHRRQIVVHHGDGSGYFPAARLADFGASSLAGLSASTVRIDGGDETRACLLLNLSGRGDATLRRARESCSGLGIGWLVDVRYDRPRIPSTQAAFEAVISYALKAWAENRPRRLAGASIIMIDSVAIVAVVLGVQFAVHPDGPWIPYEYDDGSGTYHPFAPMGHR